MTFDDDKVGPQVVSTGVLPAHVCKGRAAQSRIRSPYVGILKLKDRKSTENVDRKVVNSFEDG